MYLIFESPLYDKIKETFFDYNMVFEVDEETVAQSSEDPVDKQLQQIMNPLSKQETEKINQIKQAFQSGELNSDQQTQDGQAEDIHDETNPEIDPEQQFIEDNVDRLEQKNEALKIFYLYKDLTKLRQSLEKSSKLIENKQQLDDLTYFMDFILKFYGVFDYPTITNIIINIQKQLTKLK